MAITALREMAAIHEEFGRARDASTVWDRIADRSEEESRSEALKKAAHWAMVSLDWATAEDRVLKALDSAPTSSMQLRQALLTDLGEIRFLSGNPSSAIEPLVEASEMGSSAEGLKAFSTLGRAQEAANRPEEALETYLRIGYLYPLETSEVARSLFRAGQILEAQGNTARARAVYQKISQGAPEDWRAKADENGAPTSPDKR